MSVEAIVWQAQAPLMELVEGVSAEVKVQRLALVALSFFSATLACSVISSSLVGIVTLSTSLLSIPLAALAYLSFQVSSKLKDYNDPLELQSMKEEAKSMGFLELEREHQGVGNIITHDIVEVLDLRAKFLLLHQGKDLAQILQDAPLSYVTKNNLLSKEYIRGLFYDELLKKADIKALYSSLADMGINELMRFGVISRKEYERFEELFAKSEKIESLHRSNLLHLNSLFLGRRESILADLDRKEEKAKDSLQRAHSQPKPTSFSVVRALQNQLSAVQEEKIRVQNDEPLGKTLQREYEGHREENYKEYVGRKGELQTEFEVIKQAFPVKLL